jgi:hypothetical protein
MAVQGNRCTGSGKSNYPVLRKRELSLGKMKPSRKVNMNQFNRNSRCPIINKLLTNGKVLFTKKLLVAIGFDNALMSPFGGI